ncbi:glycosyltransferase family 39 protein [Tropicimonas sp. TH_r6]|uniref:ArnT family glycosyltransferase n=1 Tax=Tropicimonas sp. TH_r6 TaxID=3082085 RepID=UPI0029529E33|nr:glycosyltransferase family 39 protein [Tropicimonas sp. TH_r6]MDV7141376.1 glycosyltransferase family 39 protein [Tropicimonas sp. TH_r6]
MPNVDATLPADRRGWFYPAALIACAITAFRIALLAANSTDLFVDEAQYWLWGQELAFGYYSKPPFIGWTIRAFTELGGSDAEFWVRLPAPILHGVTALLLGAIAAPRAGKIAAIWVTAIYLTLPMVSVGSLMISTDTVMAPFLALALLAWWRGLDIGGSHVWSIIAGVALGLAFLAKYAAIYYVLGAGLAAIFLWQGRPGWGPALSGAVAFLLTISPNILWNLANGLSTVEHTLDNADWVRAPGDRAQLNLSGLGEFLGSQFIIFGPVLFAALLWLGFRYSSLSAERRFALFFSLPILAVVSIQALLSEAYANWAASAYLAATLLVVPWLLEGRTPWLRGNLILNGAVAILLPLLTVFGTGLRVGPDGDLLLARYLGRSEMSQTILDIAEREGVGIIVADDRDVLADLFYFNRDGDVDVYARPETGRPSNHYVLKYSLPEEVTGPLLYVRKRNRQPGNCAAPLLEHIEPEDGAYARRSQKVFLVDANCLR